MRLVPADVPGESDVMISLQRTRPLRGSWSLDDSGSTSTSRSQLNGSLYMDNPLRRNDMLTLGLSSGMTSRAGFGTSGYNASYTMPFGNWRVSANGYGYRYQQVVSGTSSTYPVSGQSQTGEVSVERLLARGQRYRTSLGLRMGQRSSHTFVAGSELVTQARRSTYATLALNLRQYAGAAQIDFRLAHKRGLPWLGGDRDEPGRPAMAPKYEYRIFSFDASLGLPLKVGHLRSYWNSQMHWQHSGDVLFGSEYIAIGGRYTINGFDGERTLASRSGGYWRNSLTFSIAPVFQPYVGVDVGKVKSHRAVGVEGGHLVGGYTGLRGQVRGGLGWDAFLGWPLQRSELFESEGRSAGFRLYLQF
ncbi:ShlB/FhaC/HecB family hemolysin secretion/activation protein [Solilutibacter pythonis]|nr:ShlB/FhaC/HecB family hemolysin secretion/activation protein [Lysobacter pythonis]